MINIEDSKDSGFFFEAVQKIFLDIFDATENGNNYYGAIDLSGTWPNSQDQDCQSPSV